MEVSKSNGQKLYQMAPVGKALNVKGNVFSKGRILVGRAESCEFVIPSGVVSAVHAVIEVTAKGAKIYDMNSTNGVYVNGEKVVAKDLSVGDEISLGNITFKFEEYIAAKSLPPVLDTLEPEKGEASVLPKAMPRPNPKTPESAPKLPKTPNVEVEEEGPYIVYPLAKDPKADYSEYIFEDADDLYPVFKYPIDKHSVEVIILHKDRVYSVDYLPEKNGTYSIVGANPKSKDIEFPYLGKKEKNAFIDIKNGSITVGQLPSYKMMHLAQNDMRDANESNVLLGEDDIIKLLNSDLEIYVRRVPAPPKVKSAPLLGRDKSLRKYFFLILLLIVLPLMAVGLFYEVDPEMDKEKDPERIATILYKQPLKISKNKAVEKTKKAPEKKQKTKAKTTPKKPEKAKPKPQPEKKPEAKKNVQADPGSKKAPKKQQVKKVKKPAPKKTAVAKSAAASSSVKSATTRSAVKRPSKGVVDTYKSANFKSTISSLMAKGGSLKGAKTATSSSSTNIGSATVGGGVATNLRKAEVGSEVGSLTGAATGKLAESKGAEGLSAKKGIYTAGIPSETVVLGSMDPDVIRRILREHIPQFRYCYQKELDRSASESLSGTIGLQFTIGASGHVSRAGVSSQTRLPSNVKKCVVRVLRGIQFPSPLGGGTVEVKQPFNFYPKRL